MRGLTQCARFWMASPLALIGLGLFPCLVCLLTVFGHYRQHGELKRKVRVLHRKDRLNREKAERTQSLIERLKGADPDYVQTVLEKRVFLAGEIRNLEAVLVSGQQLAADVTRLDLLKNGTNCLKLTEKHFQRVGNWQEVEIAQEHPVEMGSHDLMGLLAILENVQIGSHPPDPRAPNFLIDDFELVRRPRGKKGGETYAVKFHCMKREYIHE